MKPHPSIFLAALQLVDVAPADAVMVGDSVRQDVEGALRAGMRAILLHRGHTPPPECAVPIIGSLRELTALLNAESLFPNP